MKGKKINRMKKKSQMKMGESIGIIFIFILLVALGIVFWTKIKSATIQEQIGEEQTLQAIQVAQEISFLPEVQCSSENIISDNCFDIMKMEAMIEFLTQPPLNDEAMEYYSQVFRNSRLFVEVVYPYPGRNWTLYDNPLRLNSSKGDANTEAANIEFLTYSKITTIVPVALYNSTSRDYYFGKLTVDVYKR